MDELRGQSILITRPHQQANILTALIKSLGGEAIRYPAIAIKPIATRQSLPEMLRPHHGSDIAIFISPNAAALAARSVALLGSNTQVAAIGPSTAAALQVHGVIVDIHPKAGFTSEALLQDEALQDVVGKKIVIFRGEGGRALLGDKLTSRGANVSYLELYRRELPEPDSGLTEQIRDRLISGGISYVVVTSVEGLDNLCTLLDPDAHKILRSATLVTPSERVVKRAEKRGLQCIPVLANGPDDKALLEAIASRAGRTQS